MTRDYRNIKAWQLADKLAVKIYKTSAAFPKIELFGLISQIRRAAVSVPANICEGSNRGHKRDYLRFLHIAKGSLGEVEYFLHLCRKLEYLGDEQYGQLQSLCVETAKTLFGLIQSVEAEACN